MFSGNIINGYWIKLAAIKAVTDLEGHLFRQKTDRVIIFEHFLASLWSDILKSTALRCTSFSLFQDVALIIFEHREEIHFVFVFFCLLNLMP